MTDLTATALSLLIAIFASATVFYALGTIAPIISIGLVLVLGFVIGGYLPQTLIKATAPRK